MSERDERIEALAERADAWHRAISHGQQELFRILAEMDREELWAEWGARDMAHWLWMRYGLSDWKARRWIEAAHALEQLPLISQAFSRGDLGVDKVVELTRLATPETEASLIPWAERVSSGRIRREAELARRRPIEEAQEDQEVRSVSWWYSEDGRRFGLGADLPAAHGAVVARAIDRLAERVPVMPGEEDRYFTPARRADALVALAQTRIASDPDPERATVVVHAEAEGLVNSTHGCELEQGPVIHPETARRLACTGRLQLVVEDRAGNATHTGPVHRDPPAWMLRQVRYRDHGCTFPGCGSRLFTQAHHIVWWERGGRTTLDTWRWCVPSTTGWCTSMDGASSENPTAPPDGSVPTGPATGRARDHRPRGSNDNPSFQPPASERRDVLACRPASLASPDVAAR